MENLFKFFDFIHSSIFFNCLLLESEFISPIQKESFESLPKTLLIAAELDPLVDHAGKYHEKLQQFDVESELHIIKGKSKI